MFKFSRNFSPFLVILLAPTRFMRKVYNWTLHWSKSKHANLSLFLIAFAESSFFPIPPDVLLIAMTVSQIHKWWKIALITTIGSVLGGVAGYYIGYGLFEAIGRPVIDFYHFNNYFEIVKVKYEANAFWAIFTAAFTPIPYKVFTIAAGVFDISLPTLVVASFIGRAGRFFAVAMALRIFGRKIQYGIEKYFDILSLLFIGLLIGGFFVIKLLK